jgi:hypothetical protein
MSLSNRRKRITMTKYIFVAVLILFRTLIALRVNERSKGTNRQKEKPQDLKSNCEPMRSEEELLGEL